MKAAKTLLLMILFTNSQFVVAQGVYGAITGKIIGSNGENIKYAVLKLADANRTVTKAIPDSNGSYIFEKVPFGEYRMDICAVGYIKMLAVGLKIKGRDTLNVNLKLKYRDDMGALSIRYLDDRDSLYRRLALQMQSDSFQAITGTVFDEQHKPLKGITVRIYNDTALVKEMLSDKVGRYCVVLGKGVYSVNIHGRYKGRRKRKYFYSVGDLESIFISNRALQIDYTMRRIAYSEHNSINIVAY